MGNAIGAGAYIAYEEETTEGTEVTPTAKHWVRSFDAAQTLGFDDPEPLGTSDDALPNSRALFVTNQDVGGSFSVNAYYDTDFVLVLHKHAYGAVATAGSGPYTYTYTLTKDVPTKPSLTLEFVRGQDGPASSAEVMAGCRIARYVRSVETGGTVQIAIDFIGQTATDREAPTGSLSYPSGPNLAYHADITNFTFNSTQFTEILSATLTIDKRLERTPQLGSLTSGAPIMGGLAECTLEVRLRYYSNALYTAMTAGTTAAGSLTCTDGTRSIVDTFAKMQVISCSDPIGGAGQVEQTVTFRLLSTAAAGPVSTVITNGVAP